MTTKIGAAAAASSAGVFTRSPYQLKAAAEIFAYQLSQWSPAAERAGLLALTGSILRRTSGLFSQQRSSLSRPILREWEKNGRGGNTAAFLDFHLWNQVRARLKKKTSVYLGIHTLMCPPVLWVEHWVWDRAKISAHTGLLLATKFTWAGFWWDDVFIIISWQYHYSYYATRGKWVGVFLSSSPHTMLIKIKHQKKRYHCDHRNFRMRKNFVLQWLRTLVRYKFFVQRKNFVLLAKVTKLNHALKFFAITVSKPKWLSLQWQDSGVNCNHNNMI